MQHFRHQTGTPGHGSGPGLKRLEFITELQGIREFNAMVRQLPVAELGTRQFNAQLLTIRQVDVNTGSDITLQTVTRHASAVLYRRP